MSRERSKLPTVSIGERVHRLLTVEAYVAARGTKQNIEDAMSSIASAAILAYLEKLEAEREATKPGNGVHP